MIGVALVCPQSEKRSSNFMYLMVEFPRVKTNDKEYSIVYYEKVFSDLKLYITSCILKQGRLYNKTLETLLPLRMVTTLHPSLPAVTLSKFLTHRWGW